MLTLEFDKFRDEIRGNGDKLIDTTGYLKIPVTLEVNNKTYNIEFQLSILDLFSFPDELLNGLIQNEIVIVHNKLQSGCKIVDNKIVD